MASSGSSFQKDYNLCVLRASSERSERVVKLASENGIIRMDKCAVTTDNKDLLWRAAVRVSKRTAISVNSVPLVREANGW